MYSLSSGPAVQRSVPFKWTCPEAIAISNVAIKRQKLNWRRRASVAQLVRRWTLATSIPLGMQGAQVQILVDASCGRLPMHTRPGWTIQSSPTTRPEVSGQPVGLDPRSSPTTWPEAVVSGQPPGRPGAVVPGRPTGLDQSRPTNWTGLVRPGWSAWSSPGRPPGLD